MAGFVACEGEDAMPIPLHVARDEVIRAALSYQSSVMGDETNAHYGDQLELDGEILDNAIGQYAQIRTGELDGVERGG